MNEQELSKKIVLTLNHGLGQIDNDKLTRLRAARQKALAAYREPVTVLGLVTVSGQTFNVSSWIRKPMFWLPVLAIAALVATYSYNTADDVYDDVGELDAKLLTGELPIDAFLDKDFGTWVSESQH
jgi:hypothetical protein